MVKIGVLLQRQGVVVPYRTLHRFCVERCGFGRTAATVRVANGEPGAECQLGFGYLGLLFDPVSGRQRKVQALMAVDFGIITMAADALTGRRGRRSVVSELTGPGQAKLARRIGC